MDLYAAGVYKAARSLGLEIGRDISVVAYGDSPLIGILEPELTTLRLPGVEVGAMSIQILLSMLEDGECPPSVTMPLPLTIRGSTGPALQAVPEPTAQHSATRVSAGGYHVER